MTEAENNPDQAVKALNRLFVKTLKQMSAGGQNHEASKLAAEGWSVLRHNGQPEEAERLNGLLHYLTAPGKDDGKVDLQISASASKS